MKLGEVCIHNSLKRQCEMCEILTMLGGLMANKEVARIFGITIKQISVPQRIDDKLNPVYFGLSELTVLDHRILELQKHFQNQNWRIVSIEIE